MAAKRYMGKLFSQRKLLHKPRSELQSIPLHNPNLAAKRRLAQWLISAHNLMPNEQTRERAPNLSGSRVDFCERVGNVRRGF